MGAMIVWDHDESHGHDGGSNRTESYDRARPEDPSPRVHVEIEELVLTGFTRSEGLEIAASLRETLARVLADERTWGNGSDLTEVDVLDAGSVPLSGSGRARSTGERVARAISRSLPR